MSERPAFTGPDLCALSATEVVGLLKACKVSPAELVEASLARIAETSPEINATVTPCPERARAAADEASPDSLLAGLPIGIKDLTDVSGVRTTRGTRGLADFVPKVSDPLVRHMEAKGTIVIGKTNTPEEGAGANTFNAVFGATRNPWDTTRNAGGSSGGAAASLATGEAWLSHGSDYGGSLRTPANFCGIVGLRPSPGVVGSPNFTFEATQGPMARSVQDCALFLDAMTGQHPAWPLSRPAPEVRFSQAVTSDPGRIRIAYAPDQGGFGPVTPAVRAVLDRALAALAAPDTDLIEKAPDTLDLDETFRTLRGVSFLAKWQDTPEPIRRHFKPTIQQNVLEAKALTIHDVARAHSTKARLFRDMRGFFDDCDVLATAVNGLTPGPVEEEFPLEVAGQPMRDYLDWLRFSYLATVCGLPALSLPVGFSENGMPVGLQLIGPPQSEARLLQIALRFETRLALGTTPIDPRALSRA